MDQPVVWVDVEDAVRQFLRAEGLASGRVFFGVSQQAPFPQIVLQRIEGPDDSCLIQFDVRGATKATTAQLAADLASACDALSRYTNDGVLLHGADVLSVRWLPDPDSGQPRHIVDVLFAASAVTGP